MALWRKNMVIPEYERKKTDRPNYIRSSGGFYETPSKNAKTSEEHYESIEFRKLPKCESTEKNKKTYKSDGPILSCQFVVVTNRYSPLCGNYYDFTEIELDEYTDEFGVILYDAFYREKFRYVYNNGCLTRIESKKHGVCSFDERSNKGVYKEHSIFIGEMVRKLKGISQEQSGPVLTKKLTPSKNTGNK